MVINSQLEANNKDLASNKADILGVNVIISPCNELLNILRNKIQETRVLRPYFVVTVNPEFVMEAQKDEEFKKILNQADLQIADGNGLRLSDSRIQVYPGRVLVQDLLKIPKIKVFFLGGRDGVAKEMSKKYGGSWDPGSENIKYQITNNNSRSDNKISNKINKAKPDLLLVAYGHPWQEKWIARNIDKLNCKVVMGVGGTFDFLTGRSSVPPRIVAQLGLEWLWRLVHEPWRWRRQIKLIKYIILIFINKI